MLAGEEGTIYDDQIAAKVESYSHELGADVGFVSCDFTMNDTITKLDEWFSRGLGRDISVFNEVGGLVWNGFVNEISVTVGGFTVTRGPLLGISNRVKVKYQKKTWNTNPPVGGGQGETDWEDNLESQESYGVLEAVLSGGEASDTQMDQARAVYLSQFAWPDATQELSTGASAMPSISIRCQGYHSLLGKQIYNNDDTTEVDADAKIRAILAANANALFPNPTNILSNDTIVAQLEDGDSPADSLISGIVSVGDSLNRRWLFGVREVRRPYYEPVEETIFYQHRLSDPTQRVETYLGGVWVYPWNVRSGKYLLVSDFLVGTEFTESLMQDPRLVFLETVSYSAPWTLSLTGGRVSTALQYLNKLGLGGI